MRDFRKLKVWKKAHHFTLQVCRITKNFPSDERFGLTVQLRRAAASIPMNIAEAMVSEEIVSENLPGL